MARVVILGGGLTGLSVAYYLEKQNCFDYCLFEKNHDVGGLIRSVQQSGFTFDYTGHLLHINNPLFHEFLKELIGFENLIEHNRLAFVWSHKTYLPYPFQENLHALPTESIIECIEGFIKRSKASTPTSFYSWVIKHFGAGMAKHFFIPYNEKLLCSPAKTISSSWIGRFIPKTTLSTIINNLKNQPEVSSSGYNSNFYYPRNDGIGLVAKRLQSSLKNRIHLNHEVVEINSSKKIVYFSNGHAEPYSQLISTIPLHNLLCLLFPVTTLNTTSKKLHAVDVLNFNLGINRPNLSDKHWVYVPERDLPLYRFGFYHNFSPSATPKGHSSIYGELSFNPETTRLSYVQRQADIAIAKLLDILQINQENIILRHDLLIKNAYVLYDKWRDKNLSKLIFALTQLSIHSIGRFGSWQYSSMQEAVISASEIAHSCICDQVTSQAKDRITVAKKENRSDSQVVRTNPHRHCKRLGQAATALVVGGAGFIGSHIVELLLETGANVTVLDNLSTGSLDNLKSVLDKIELIVGDIRSESDCLNATRDKTHLFHLAAMVSVPESVKNPDLCHEINLIGTQTLLDAARKNTVPPVIIFSSSSAVYGVRNTPCKEADILNPESPYANSKIAGERLCKRYSDQTGQRSVSLRYFNVYGPRQNPAGIYAGVVAKFRSDLINHRPIVIFGDGRQTRDFVHVSDVARANLTVASCSEKLYDVFNIGTGTSISLLELIEKLERETNVQRTTISFLPARAGDIVHSRADCSKYKTLLQKEGRKWMQST